MLYVGRRSHYKNFSTLLQAYSVWKHRNEITLAAVGPPGSRVEEQQLAKLGIHDRVHYLTNVNDEELCLLYNEAIAFVYPSLYEGFGVPLLEAMASGCPIIASRIPATIEVAGECPVYFEATEVGSLLGV